MLNKTNFPFSIPIQTPVTLRHRGIHFISYHEKSAIEIRYLADMRADIRSSSVFLCKICHRNPLLGGYASGYQVFKCIFMQNPPWKSAAWRMSERIIIVLSEKPAGNSDGSFVAYESEQAGGSKGGKCYPCEYQDADGPAPA